MTAQRKEECGAEQIKLLKKKGKISVDMELLQDIKKYYHAGNNIVHIFEPPKIGEDILLLEHFVSSRDNINTRCTFKYCKRGSEDTKICIIFICHHNTADDVSAYIWSFMACGNIPIAQKHKRILKTITNEEKENELWQVYLVN